MIAPHNHLSLKKLPGGIKQTLRLGHFSQVSVNFFRLLVIVVFFMDVGRLQGELFLDKLCVPLNIFKFGVFEVGAQQIAVGQVGTVQVGAPKVDFHQRAVAKVGIKKMAVRHVGPIQI